MDWSRLLLMIFATCLPLSQVSAAIQATIPATLTECYRNQSLLLRENLLPNTLSSLLAILRKIESSTLINMDMRTLASTLLMSYRLDGIEKNPQVTATDYIIPYSPSGSQFYRYKLLMDGLIPNSGLTIPNGTLTSIEKCSLHSMLSSSVDLWERGDEGSVCNSLKNLAQTWDNGRIPRSVNNKNLDNDAETFDPLAIKKTDKTQSGNFLSGVPRSYMDTYTDTALSSCPIENGVIYTKYGSVKIGMVLAGIAAGLQSQTVSQNNLFQLAARGKTYKRPSTMLRGLTTFTSTPSVSNRWVATLSGEIAELSLLQGPINQQSMRVGLSGGWNDTLVPRYYFLSEQSRDALTDTDIRGAVDGLLMATNIQNWRNVASTLKLSQLLDMYYSDRGVFDKTIRACQRQDRFSTIAPTTTMLQESIAFSEVLQLELPIAVNLAVEAIEDLNTIAVSKISTYVPSMATTTCETSSSSTTITAKPAISLYIVIDFNYDFLTAQQIINYIVESAEVSRFSCNISVINAKDGKVLVNSTQTPLDFNLNFTRTNYTNGAKGFDLPKIIQEIGVNLTRRLDYDRVTLNSGGPSTVVLIIPYSTSTIADSDRDYISKKLAYYNQILPDVKFMYLTTGSKERFSSFVTDPTTDIFLLTTTDIANSINPLITRLSRVPRRIINPWCTSSYYGSSSNNLVLTDYLEPLGVHYYRVHPNYFYRSGSGRIRIQGSSSAVLSVCLSRTNPLPGANSTSSDSSCSQITSGYYDIPINDQTCSGASYAYLCRPIYFSVTATQTTTTTNYYQCSDDGCRYPDSIRFTIMQDGLTCYSNAHALRVSLAILLCTTILRFFN
uniref:Uncharacterized protein n=1 Tax=Clastoptera arizonana TaxID=38151 RepID=A0A1B6D0F0_9HEMI